MLPIDRKFKIFAECHAHGHQYTEMDGVFFKVADAGLPAALGGYRHWLVDNHVDPRQIKGVDLLIERVHEWQRLRPELVKHPDVDPGEEEQIVNRPNESDAVKCKWCWEPYSKHVDSRPKGTPEPRMNCKGLKTGYVPDLPRG